MLKGKVSSTHHASHAMWSKWIALIIQQAQIENPNRPGILEVIMKWPEGENFELSSSSPSEEEKLHVLMRPYDIISYQKMERDTASSLMLPAVS
ncbi:hypothetical protein DUI87_19100 [Hirundo rustica rustica]|uniref:Uncharacterized protein n=1 Tax=Hirundo rustica rustica TaxID=333673 RepID=A0A3M0JVR3_HIRRU|nr:hypothetical protein DUI87_19100 [Hirundo rustica rustica]